MRATIIHAGERESHARIDDPMSTSDMRGPVGEISVYRDGMRLGRVQDLKYVGVHDVAKVECLTAADAAQRFGLNTTGGAIVLTSR